MRTHNILVITYWPLTNALISTYTLPYLRIIKKILPAGSDIYLMTLSPVAEKRSDQFKRVHASVSREGITIVDFSYHRFGARFLMKAPLYLLKLGWLVVNKKITTLHGWCTPGGAIGYLLKLITRKTLILDSFEPHAEAMVETGVWRKNGFNFRLLYGLEKRQLQSAREVISAAPGMMDYAARKYGVRREEKFVKPACVDLRLFAENMNSNRSTEGFTASDVICVYAGKFGGIYLEQETFDFFAVAASYWRDRFRVLLLTSHSDDEIRTYCERSGFDFALVTKRFVPHEEVPRYLSMGDFGICPVKPVPTKRYCSPIKDGEYWALGLPVAITDNISIDSELIREHNAGAVIKKFNVPAYTECCETLSRILADPGHRARIRNLAVRYRHFDIAENIYREIYGNTVSGEH